MKIALRYRGNEKEIDVPEGQTIAEAVRANGMNVLGSCGGQGLCAQCSCFVRAGMQSLFTVGTGEPAVPSGYAPFAMTCKTIVTGEGVSIDTDRRARR